MKITFLGGASCTLIDEGNRPSPYARWGLAGDQLPDLCQIDRAGGLELVKEGSIV